MKNKFDNFKWIDNGEKKLSSCIEVRAYDSISIRFYHSYLFICCWVLNRYSDEIFFSMWPDLSYIFWYRFFMWLQMISKKNRRPFVAVHAFLPSDCKEFINSHFHRLLLLFFSVFFFAFSFMLHRFHILRTCTFSHRFSHHWTMRKKNRCALLHDSYVDRNSISMEVCLCWALSRAQKTEIVKIVTYIEIAKVPKWRRSVWAYVC